jgi:predicted MPP superfamily phosphohydrolase
VQLPGLGPLITQSEIPNHIAAGGFFPEHPAGPLNLSSGAGNVRHDKLPRLRFNCPPEIVVIDLVPRRRLPEQED